MKTSKNIILILFSFLMVAISCNKKEEMSDLDKLRASNNKKSYPVTKMDSAKAIQFITKQKIQELYDLSTLYTSGNKDTEIDSIIYSQMKGYFAKSDSLKLKPFLKQLDSFKVKSAKVGNIEISKKISGKDTLDFAKFNVEYFDKARNSLGNFPKKVQYTLTLSPVKFKREFKFYFVDFDVKEKDSTSVAKTK